MSAPVEKKRPATLADLLALPAEPPREIIDGELRDKDAASGRHGGAQASVVQLLRPYKRKPGGRWPGGWWLATEVAVYFADDQVFRPDVAGWRREHLAELPAEVPIRVPPDGCGSHPEHCRGQDQLPGSVSVRVSVSVTVSPGVSGV